MANVMHNPSESSCTCNQQSGSNLLQGIGAVADAVSRWHVRARQRQALAELNDHLLADIGVPPAAARREADKPFWS